MKRSLTCSMVVALCLTLACSGSDAPPTPEEPKSIKDDGLAKYVAAEDLVGRPRIVTDGPIIIIRPAQTGSAELVVTADLALQAPTGTSVFDNGCTLRSDFIGMAVSLFDKYSTRIEEIDTLTMSSATVDISVEETDDGFAWSFTDDDGNTCNAVAGPIVKGQVPVEFRGLKTSSLRGDGGTALASRMRVRVR